MEGGGFDGSSHLNTEQRCYSSLMQSGGMQHDTSDDKVVSNNELYSSG